MHVLYFGPGQAAKCVDPGDRPEPAGHYWLDIERTETDLYPEADRWLDTNLQEAHLAESLEGRMPFYDGTDAYDLLVMRTLDVESPADAPVTRPVAIFITARVIVSIRPPGDAVFERLRERLLKGQRKSPETTIALLSLLLNRIVVQLLDRRETVSELVSQWQDQLLDHDEPFDAWRGLVRLRTHLARLEDVSEAQLDALSGWREQTSLEPNAENLGHFDALEKDLRRVFEHAVAMQTDIDALVQIHYAIVGQKTNEILRTLTIISVVFLPLNLIAGIYGMNFTHLPFVESTWAPWATVGVMLCLAALLYFLLSRKRWF
jgi:Mg2+ and Co2+ transporter CorA